MVEYQEYTKSYLLTCDSCGRHDSVRTAKTEQEARKIAEARLKWQVDTPRGDLCRSCSSKQPKAISDA